MPVAFKGFSGYDLLVDLDVPQQQAAWLSAHGFKVQVFVSEIRISNGDVAASVAVKLDHLHQLKAGTIGDLAKKTLRMSILGALKQLEKKFGQDSPGDVAVPPPGAPDLAQAVPPPKPGFLKQLQAAAPLAGNLAHPALEPAPAASPAWPAYPPNKMQADPPGLLQTATRMYEPVRGSSKGSRYFLIAANAELRVAARLKNHSLSLRIEGPCFVEHKQRISQVGVTNVNTNYASMHLEVQGSLVTANKAVGAILLGLGIKFDTPTPDLQLIAGKGS